MIDQMAHPLFEAIRSADIAAIECMAASGINLNLRDEYGDPALFAAIQEVEFSEGADRERFLSMSRRMIELGADPRVLASDGASILIGPILRVNPELVAFLLQHGVDPNHGCSEPWETVYDAALFDYAHEAFFLPSLPYLDPPDDLGSDEDAFLEWLDREAASKGYLRPSILLLLREHGALTGKELVARLGGASGQSVRWKEGGWVLND